MLTVLHRTGNTDLSIIPSNVSPKREFTPERGTLEGQGQG